MAQLGFTSAICLFASKTKTELSETQKSRDISALLQVRVALKPGPLFICILIAAAATCFYAAG